MDTKLYVGNLSFDTSEDGLRELFGRAGTVSSVTLIKDRATGRSKGFGFVEMGTQSEAESAIKMFNGFSFGDRELKVDKARPPEENSFSRGNQFRSQGSDRKRRMGSDRNSGRY